MTMTYCPPMTSKIEMLKDRAHLLGSVRSFFTERNVMEVDCAMLSPTASIDAHIDLIPALYQGTERRYLHSSPEYPMKRLLAEGCGDIYQLSHVFRDGEWGTKHNPEFMMVEWYRLGMSFTQLMDETCQLVSLFLGDLTLEYLTYREAFKKYTGIDYVTTSNEELLAYIQKEHIPRFNFLDINDKDALLNLILASKVEPFLGQDKLSILCYYPSSQAALAQTQWKDDEEIAERFEIYYKGVELCNGYHELANLEEQKWRLQETNLMREQLGKSALPMDESFLKALETGLPDCCGVAVGFDRLMMLRQKATCLQDILPFGWDKI